VRDNGHRTESVLSGSPHDDGRRGPLPFLAPLAIDRDRRQLVCLLFTRLTQQYLLHYIMSTEAEPSKEGFYRSFKISFDNLQDAISKLPNTTAAERNATIDKHLESIAELSQSLKDIAALLPAYDQRFYGDQIKTLETQLRKARSEGGGTKKFSFKKREKPVASETSSPASSGPSLDGKASTISPEPDQRTEEQKSQSIPVTLTYPQPVRATASADTLIISLLDASYAVFPPGSSASSGTITMINDSVVDLSARTMTAPLATLIVKNVNASLIVCGRVSGPLHISNLNRSVIVTSCQQFRLHDATDVDVYIHCASRPIIENCKNVRFAPLPPYYVCLSLQFHVVFFLLTQFLGNARYFSIGKSLGPDR